MTRVVFILLIIANSGFSQSSRTNSAILARAGDRDIEESEFVERFELSPGLNRRPGKALQQAKVAFVYSLVAEKLLAQAGEERGVDKDTTFRNAFYEMRKLIARDLLYREEISKKVQVTRTEIRKGMEEARRQLTVSFIFFDDRSDAEFVRKQIRTPAEFEALGIDSSMKALRDTATVIWGDAEWEIERQAYLLKPKTVSGVVAAGSGYYLLKILSERPSEHYNSLSVEALQHEVSETLRLRKERARLDEYVRIALKDKQGYAIRKSVAILASACATVLQASEFRSDSTLTPAAVHAMMNALSTNKSDSVAVVESRVWTMQFILGKLESASLPIPARDPPSLFGLLSRQLMMWVQQELLAQEGLRRKLDELPDGARKLAVWRDAMLASAMREKIAASVRVDESDMWNYVGGMYEGVHIPNVTIRELWSGSLPRIQEAVRALQKGGSFNDVVTEYSQDSLSTSGGMVTFPITNRRPLGDIAYSLSPGESYGPIQIGKRYLLFQLLHKDTVSLQGQGLTKDQVEKAEKEAKQMKGRRAKNEFLAAEGKKRGFTLFEDQIVKTEVSPIPMMTFRILGFGGRMMEVPFVDPDLQWLDIDVPDAPIP